MLYLLNIVIFPNYFLHLNFCGWVINPIFFNILKFVIEYAVHHQSICIIMLKLKIMYHKYADKKDVCFIKFEIFYKNRRNF